jgi:MSHA biogenesis protein MshO
MTGFTLIEMITVIVVLSIISTIGFTFVRSTMESYNTTINRGKLITKGRLVLERITRQIRAAVPNSVRVVNNCVEFLPIAGGGNYTGVVADIANGIDASVVPVIPTVSHAVDFGSALYVVIGGLSESELYSATPVSLATLSSRTTTSLTLSAPKTWQRNSLNKRFFLADNPEFFCQVGAQLQYFNNDADTPYNSSGSPTGSGDIVSNGVTSVSFALSSGTEDRGTTMAIAVTFAEGGESVVLNQEVYIRNVP